MDGKVLPVAARCTTRSGRLALYNYTPMAYDNEEWNLLKARPLPVIFRSISTMKGTRHCKTSLPGTPKRGK